MSTSIIVKDGQATPVQQTLQLPDISAGGNPKIAIAEPLPAGTNAIGSITNISGTVSLPTGAATAANQTTTNTSIASVDTKTPALGQALAAASVPVVLTAVQQAALTPPADTTTTGNITAVDASSTSVTVTATGQTITTGTPTTNSFVSAVLNACSTIEVQLIGTFTSTVTFERSVDNGQTWVPVNLTLENVGTSMGSATTIGVWRGNVAGKTNFRVRCTAFTSGSIAVTIVAAKGVENVFVGNGVRQAAYTNVDRSGTTSSTINTKTQAAASNTSRGGGGVIIENTSATATLQVWIGVSGSETKYPSGLLLPNVGSSYCQVTSTDRVAISSTDTASVPFVAVEGVYS